MKEKTLKEAVFSNIMLEGGREIMRAKIIEEWWPEIFSRAEYNWAVKTLQDSNLQAGLQPKILSQYNYTRKKLALLKTA